MTNNFFQNTNGSNAIKNIIKGIIISFVITFAFIMLISVILVNTNVTENIITPGICVITCISLFIGTMSSVQNNGILYGAIIGIIYIISLYIISSVLNGDFKLTIMSTLLIAISIVSGVLGGITGVNLKRL